VRRDRSTTLTRVLLRGGVVAGPVFLGVATVAGLRRPGYRAMRHPVSSLALGERGGVQVANFAAAGALCGAFALGLARLPGGSRLGPVLIALSAGGLLACGVFPADPVNGYPPGTPPTPEHMTRAGYAHLIASSAIMAGVPATTALHAWLAHRSGDRRWARISAAAAALTAASFTGACAGFAQVSVLPRVAGALQRTAVSIAFAWLAALAVRTRRGLQR
jgi:hypothetical protein